MPDPASTMVEPHDRAEELLPWYATGQLDAEDVATVERHLSSCAHCRRQLAIEHRMAKEFAHLSPEADAGWARLRHRLEPRPRKVRQRVWGTARRGAADLLQTFSRPAIATLAVAQLAFVILVGSLALSLGRPTYRALGSAPPPPSANVVAIFRADTTEAQLRDLLKANGASLVDGPTDADAYLMRVPASSRAAVVARLKADRHVVMAEPIDKAAS